MIAIGLSVVTLFAFGYFLVGPANRGYTSRAWCLLVTFLAFMYLFAIVMSLILGGAISGRPVVPVDTQLVTIVYAAGAALATGLGAGLRSRRDR